MSNDRKSVVSRSKITNHFAKCFLIRCIKCFDCIAIGLLYLNESGFNYEELCSSYNERLDSIAGIFMKFIRSTISNRHLHCQKGISYDDAWDFAKILIKLNKDERNFYRKRLLCHMEFKGYLYDVK